MAQSSIWWLLAGGAVAIELLTGTFYLLMLGTGLAAAAIAAHLGGTPVVQVVVAALVGSGSVMIWRRIKLRRPVPAPASANHDVNLDIGGVVHVDAWSADGGSRVNYRGTQWSVALAGEAEPAPAMPGSFRIVEIVGSVLMVEKI
jgi:membrane protein implicated in regulation of membrane protease activity